MSSAEVSHWRAFLHLIEPETGRYGGITLLVAVGAALPVLGPVLLGRIVDEAADGADVDVLTRLAVLFLVVAVCSQLLQVVLAWVATTVAWGTANRLRLELTEHVMALDRSFHVSHTPGELVQRIDGDVTAVADFLARVVIKIGGGLMLIVGMLVALLFVDVRVALIAAVYVAVAVGALVVLRDRATDESADQMSADAELFGGIEERLSAVDDLRGNGAAGYSHQRFVTDSQRVEARQQSREGAWVRVWRVSNMILAGGMALAVGGGAMMLSAGWVTIGTVFVLVQYAQLLHRPLDQIIEEIQVVQKAAGGMRRSLELLAVRSSVVDAGRSSPGGEPLDVELDNVSVDYGDGVPALDGVTLRLAPGQTLGVIGRTGSGKSTLSRVVLRQLDPTGGGIRLGGVSATDISLSELRRRVALVPQEVHLLAGSVRDNVTLFDTSVGDDDVRNALAAVGLDDLAAGDLDRPVGAAGRSVSAGEGQLIALARVWLREPDIIVLDEATARVDPATEARIEQATAELLAGRSAIVIAHRLSTLEHLDEIAVLDSGRLVEHGHRETLKATPDSRYADLLNRAGGGAVDELLA